MSSNREQFRPEGHDNDHFLLTTVVGSYPKPKWLDRANDLYEDSVATESQRGEGGGTAGAPDFGAEELAEAEDDAARLITEEHERAGIDVVVDGEMRRNEMVEFFADRIEVVVAP